MQIEVVTFHSKMYKTQYNMVWIYECLCLRVCVFVGSGNNAAAAAAYAVDFMIILLHSHNLFIHVSRQMIFKISRTKKKWWYFKRFDRILCLRLSSRKHSRLTSCVSFYLISRSEFSSALHCTNKQSGSAIILVWIACVSANQTYSSMWIFTQSQSQ